MPKQEKIELYFYSSIPPNVELRQNIAHVMKGKAVTKKFSDDNGRGYKIILWTDVIPAYVRAGRLKRRNDSAEFIPRWNGLLEQLIYQTKSKKFAFRHVFDNGYVKDFEPYE
jgi:hypothetical protein